MIFKDDERWIEYDLNKSDDVLPPEGIGVAVTDGESIDVMWIVYSGGAEWHWYNPEDLDGFSDHLPFQPTHWMTSENSLTVIREKNIKMLLEY